MEQNIHISTVVTEEEMFQLLLATRNNEKLFELNATLLEAYTRFRLGEEQEAQQEIKPEKIVESFKKVEKEADRPGTIGGGVVRSKLKPSS